MKKCCTTSVHEAALLAVFCVLAILSVLIKSSTYMCVHVHAVYIVEMDLELWGDWNVGL